MLTSGWDRAVQQTGADAKQLKRTINGEWIYPPVDDAELILPGRLPQDLADRGDRGGIAGAAAAPPRCAF